jgi:uncharacterized protein
MPAFDPYVALGGALTGLVVGMTGMGGGALMTPILVLLFGVNPLTAVSSDIVASMVMKPIGGAVHWRRGTVNMGMVKWLMLGSIPSAFLGVVALRRFESGPAVQEAVKLALGAALLLVAIGLVAKPLLTANKHRSEDLTPLTVKPLRTIVIGILGGLVVGLTSVGSGSLMIILLLMLYPRLKLSELVGTDLVQAVPLVASAAIAHMIFGSFELGLTVSILVGSIPGIFVGARLSSRAPDYVVRPSLVVVLLVSALKLLGAPGRVLAFAAPVALTAGVGYALWAARRARAARPREDAPAVLVGNPGSVPGLPR